MKVKELVERLQSLDQELEVYIWNEKEHSLFFVEDVHETSDFGENEKGENEWGDFVTIFPKFIPEYSKLEKLEYRNLSQETANCDKFTLTPEEAELVRQALLTEKNVIIDIHVKYPAVDDYIIPTRDKINNLLNRIKEWKGECDNSE